MQSMSAGAVAQPHGKVLPAPQPHGEVLPAPQPHGEVLPAPQSHGEVLPTLQPQSGVMPAPQLNIQAVPNPPSFDPEHNLHRFFNNPGGAGQSEVSAHLADSLASSYRYHQEHEAALAAVGRRYPWLSEAAAICIQEALQYPGPTLRKTAFWLPRIFRRREAPPLAATSAPELADVCVVCMDASKDWLYVPCGHLAMCGACKARVKQQAWHCPICQKKIKQVMQVYRT